MCGLLWSVVVYGFDSELAPGEGIPRFAAKTNHLVLHEYPSTSSAVIADDFVNRGQEIQYDETRFRTVADGLVVARQSGRLLGRDFGRANFLSEELYYSRNVSFVEIAYESGESFDYLQYRAEGNCLIRHRGIVFEVDGCPWEKNANGSAEDFDVVRRPSTQWWVEVIDEQGSAAGWLLVDEGSVEFLPREF